MSTLSARRPLALLAVLGMVAALLFAVVGTASAATVTPSDEALFSACPENASIPDAGFVDVPAASNSFDAINCLAYYAVTAGTGSDTYGPSETVSRTQMAVFLARMAENAGVELASAPTSAGFTDIGGLSAEAQDAINALAATTPPIVSGTSATTFNPTGTVSRTQMALFLTRFSDAASAPSHGPGGIQAKNVSGTTTNFTDISSVVATSQTAITRVFHLGVASGTTATTYDPTSTVSRAQMAMFMTRLMSQMNTRPAGVNIQANPMSVEGDIVPAGVDPLLVKYSVTARNADFSPDNASRVDAFKFYADNATDTPFKTDGTCDAALELDVLYTIQPGATPTCRLTVADDNTTNWSNSHGNFGTDYTTSVAANTAFTTLYAWTGPLDTVFNSGTTYSSVVITGNEPAPTWDSVDLSINTDTGVVPLGTAVMWTAQLMDGGMPWAEADVEVEFRDQWGTSDTSDTTTTVKTDAFGKATYTRTETVASHSSVSADAGMGACCPVSVKWTDDAAEATKLVVTTPVEYQVLATAPATTPPVKVTATVYDQYGDVFTAAGNIQFKRDTVNEGGSLALVNGVAFRDYAAPTSSQSDDLWAVLVGASIPDSSKIEFYWVKEGVDDTYDVAAVSTPMGGVKVADVANSSVVVYVGTTYWVLRWDSGDTFLDSGGASSQADFEKAIKALEGFDVAYEATAADVSVWNLK